MIATLEKVVWCLTALVVLAMGGALFVLGPLKQVPPITMKSKVAESRDFVEALPKTPDSVEILKDRETDVFSGSEGKSRAPRFKTERRLVNPPVAEAVGNWNLCRQQASYMGSKVTEDGGLEISGFSEESVASKLGLQEKDVIMGINGQTFDFDAMSKLSNVNSTRAVVEEFLDAFKSGEPISVDIKRNGKPTRLIFLKSDF